MAVGSANFTNTALGKGRQYEELLVYDSSYNNNLCELFLDRFDRIYKNSLEFLSETTKKKLKNYIIKTDAVFFLTTDEKTDTIVDRITDATSVVTSAQPLVIEVMEEKQRLEEKILEIERIEKIVEQVTKKHKDGYIFESKEKLRNLKDKLKEFVTKTHKKTEELIDKRNWLYFNRSDQRVYIKEGENAILYTSEESQEKIKEELIKLGNFIESYFIFGSQKDREVLKRCFESVLFAFVSPFIWLMRRELKKDKAEEKVAEIPVILILGGLANTGKTKLLLFINKLLGNRFEVFNYRDIYHRNQRILYDLFGTENLFPILVDEIYDNFFKGEGERLIKSLTNILVDPHPCLLGTSNIGFSAEAQVIRRIYYLHFESPFSEDRNLKKNADSYFEEKVGFVDDYLFKVFSFRFIKLMQNGDYFRLEDPLWGGRRVFRELYEEVGLAIPDFVGERPYGDYYKTGSIEWQALFLTKKDEFKEMKDAGETYLVIDLRSLYDARDAEQLKNKLPPSVVKSPGTPMIIYKKRFYDFIGYKEGFGRKIIHFLKR